MERANVVRSSNTRSMDDARAHVNGEKEGESNYLHGLVLSEAVRHESTSITTQSHSSTHSVFVHPPVGASF